MSSVEPPLLTFPVDGPWLSKAPLIVAVRVGATVSIVKVTVPVAGRALGVVLTLLTKKVYVPCANALEVMVQGLFMRFLVRLALPTLV